MTFQPNPVALRESRAMWRGARSFLLLLCYAGALSLVAYLAYAAEVRSANEIAWYQSHHDGGSAFMDAEPQVQSARVGHTLFVALSFVQLVAWLLIAPALSATSISSERERGLLESLLMSSLKPRQIIAGKLSVSASFVALLIVATLPILAMCFLLGGVSPGEFGGALAIQLSTAFYALSLGVWCSASSRLSTHALGATFAFLVVWLFVTFVGMSYDSSSHHWLAQALRLFALLNPLVGLNELINSNPNTYEFRNFFLDASLRWPICVVAQVLVGARFLVLASRRVSGSLDEEEEPAKPPRRASRFSEAATASTWSEQSSHSEHEGTAQGTVPRAGDVYFEVPILKHLVFGSPLLRHYLRSSWRWKLPRGRSLKIWKLGAGAFVIANLGAVHWVTNYPRYAAESVLVFLLTSCALLAAVFVTASSGLSIARDRELGTWNHLRLSSIRAPQIALAKMLAPLLSALSYCALLAGPLFVVALWVLCANAGADDGYGPDLSHCLWWFPFWLLGTLQLSGWASICSLRARRSSIALVAAFAGALIFLIGVPVVLELSFSNSGDYSGRHLLQQWIGLVHPFYAMITASDLDSYQPAWRNPGLYIASLLSHAAIAYAFYRAVVKDVARLEK